MIECLTQNNMIAKRQRELLAEVRDEAMKHFRGARGSHDWDHTERVFRLAERIARKEGADLFIVRLAAVLHDVDRAAEDRTNGRVCHALRGAQTAALILKKHGLDLRTSRRVAAAIRTHRFRGRLRPRTLEARVLFDADKLDSIGAIGVGRAFLFAGEVGARLHNSDVDLATTEPYTREDTAYREFTVKLGRVKDRIFTAEGKRIAAERHRFMAGFFARLGKEEAGIL